jgi:hypothetical protein
MIRSRSEQNLLDSEGYYSVARFHFAVEEGAQMSRASRDVLKKRSRKGVRGGAPIW